MAIQTTMRRTTTTAKITRQMELAMTVEVVKTQSGSGESSGREHRTVHE